MAIKNYNVFDSDVDNNLKKAIKALKEINGEENTYFTINDDLSSGSTITCKIDDKDFLKFEKDSNTIKVTVTGKASDPFILKVNGNSAKINNIYSSSNGFALSFGTTTTETPFSMIVTKDENSKTTLIFIGSWTSSNFSISSSATLGSVVTVLNQESDQLVHNTFTPVPGKTIQLLPFQTEDTSINYTPHAFWLPYTPDADKTKNRIITVNNKDYLTNNFAALEI